MKLEGLTAVITGGTRGIGLEIARLLLARGARPIVLGRSDDRLERALASTPGLDGFVCDITHPGAPDRIRAELAVRGRGLRILFNNAGIQHATSEAGEIWDAPGGLTEEISVNVQALSTLTYRLLPDLCRRTPAAVVNVSSGLAIAPKRSAPIYCATKAYVRSFTRAMRYRVEDAGVGVHVMDAVLPLVDTDMTEGRGSGKLSARAAASAIVRDLEREKTESRVGKVKLLCGIHRIWPNAAFQIMRNW